MVSAGEQQWQQPRILIVRVGAMGDVLHGMPAVAALRQALPHAFLGWAIEPRWSSLLQAGSPARPGTPAMPLINCLHPVETRLWSSRPFSFATVRSILRLGRELRQQRYDLAMDLQGSIRSAVIARLSGAKAVMGNAFPRENAAKHFYGLRVRTTRSHVVEQAVEIASAALQRCLPGAEALTPGTPALPRDTGAEAWCDALLAAESRPLVFLAPTAGWGAKEWPAERYGAVAANLQANGCRVLVNAVSEGDPVAAVVIAAAKQLGAVGTEAVSSTLPQLTALLRRTSLVVAGDTGPLHLAAALGRPVIALFGPTNPARNGPYSTPAIVLRDPASTTDHRRRPSTEAGLLRIPVEAVVAAARKMLML